MDAIINTHTAKSIQKWCLPLALPGLLYPLAQYLNGYCLLNNNILTVYDLKLAVFSAALVLFGFRVLPGFILFLALMFVVGPQSERVDALCLVMASTFSYAAYRNVTGRRSCASFGRIKISLSRLIWLCGFNILLYLLFSRIFAAFVTHGHRPDVDNIPVMSLEMLVRIQGIINGCLTGIPFFYKIYRIIRRPSYLLTFIRAIVFQCKGNITAFGVSIWCILLISLMFCLTSPHSPNIFFSFYSLILLFPLMLWGAIKIGHSFTMLVWTVVLIILGKHNDSYIASDINFMLHQALVSTLIFVFSLTIVIMGALAKFTRQRFNQVLLLGLTDPMTGMANLRALKTELFTTEGATVCLIQIPELELFSRRYGFHFRARYQKILAEHLRSHLIKSEKVYYHAGYDLLIRLENGTCERLCDLYQAANSFRLFYNNHRLGFRSGLGYCLINDHSDDIYQLVGKLGMVAGLSLTNGRPENLEAQHSRVLGNHIVDKTEIRTALQNALDNNAFVLMAQPIVSTHGEAPYHEILIRMLNERGEFIPPNSFLPVAHDAGLAPDIDLWVIENTLKFMRTHPQRCFAINLAPVTVCRSNIVSRITQLLHDYAVEPQRIIFEITEADTLSDKEQTVETLSLIRQLGCRVAIDDFGTGFASHARLMNIEADILKIDGSFIRRITESEISYYIVESFCRVAEMKNMQVVAEFVENANIQACLEKMNVGWLQGYHIGKPTPLLTLE
ncbi:MAG: EAL domain-containing protein [Citrobacter freundii]|uniref:EAL domain-containing protein n=1 Tax=Citrobacter cronae TaxID=1748967 RepID=A0A7X1EHS6_9ENTR|nr:EAL domain-containing protein [Citrobacter cronae]MBS6076547.1 EAL domain-containing protein [Citrobacter freundii]MBY6247058.1 EAL domain-containing protein [Citrobacter werkmanii]MBY6251529.1 EAL domain-containing protein [Citrobacter werkmanii]NBD81438.1 EAL domain-containing protein [Citrobacter werkmanii]